MRRLNSNKAAAEFVIGLQTYYLYIQPLRELMD